MSHLHLYASVASGAAAGATAAAAEAATEPDAPMGVAYTAARRAHFAWQAETLERLLAEAA